jgi:zinc transport system substrate-binding protein
MMFLRVLRFLPLALLLAAPTALAAPKVVVSIKPVQSLAARVMTGAGAPALLVAGAASPHSYSLKPSDMKALEDADLVFWIGPGFETFLAQPLAAAKARPVALIDAPDVTLLRGRTGGLWDTSREAKDAGIDPHLWLDPANARAMAREMAARLSAVDPANAARYAANAQALGADLEALDTELRTRLMPARDKTFIVFHDATRYFETRYGLAGIGAVTLGPERPPGARRVDALRARMAQNDVACLFTEAQIEPKLIATLKGQSRVKTAALDPEGVALTPGPTLYFDLMRGLARGFADCLTGG